MNKITYRGVSFCYNLHHFAIVYNFVIWCIILSYMWWSLYVLFMLFHAFYCYLFRYCFILYLLKQFVILGIMLLCTLIVCLLLTRRYAVLHLVWECFTYTSLRLTQNVKHMYAWHFISWKQRWISWERNEFVGIELYFVDKFIFKMLLLFCYKIVVVDELSYFTLFYATF